MLNAKSRKDRGEDVLAEPIDASHHNWTLQAGIARRDALLNVDCGALHRVKALDERQAKRGGYQAGWPPIEQANANSSLEGIEASADRRLRGARGACGRTERQAVRHNSDDPEVVPIQWGNQTYSLSKIVSEASIIV
jgi:hypothetical protein